MLNFFKKMKDKVITPPRKNTPTIAIINQSIISDVSLIKVINALRIQLDRDFFPIWNHTANLVFYGKGSQIPAGIWQLIILDDENDSSFSSYHELTLDQLPISRIFIKTDQKFGLSWTVSISHELLEMLIDPYMNMAVASGKEFIAYEICDPCQSDLLGYMIDNVRVSDFVTPEWFQTHRIPNSTKFDFVGKLLAPLSVWAGGYIIVWEENKGWIQRTLEPSNKRMTSNQKYSRFLRRKMKN